MYVTSGLSIGPPQDQSKLDHAPAQSSLPFKPQPYLSLDDLEILANCRHALSSLRVVPFPGTSRCFATAFIEGLAFYSEIRRLKETVQTCGVGVTGRPKLLAKVDT